MVRFVVCLILLFGFMPDVDASNVRIVKEAKVDPNTGVVSTDVGYVAVVDFSIAWDNSWKDDYNWDAVYVFLKYKKTTETNWKHVWLRDQYHSCSKGYQYAMARSTTTANRALGAFIYRGNNSSGSDTVDVKLHWMIGNQGISQSDFISGRMEYSLMCVEMVYIPKGPFWLGDGVAANRFRTKFYSIPEEWDLIKNDGRLKFWANGDRNSDHYKYYSPDKAANHVNGGARSTAINNAWYAYPSDATATPYWKVDFGEAKTIRYFGVSGVPYSTHSYHRPNSWKLKGSNNDSQWYDLMPTTGLTADDWTEEYDSYPVPKAIKVERPGAYRYYMIEINTFNASYWPMASNIAMTDHDLETEFGTDSYMVNDGIVRMNLRTHLSDGAAGFGNDVNLNGNYPKGFEGFYVMKYEVSQEQWVGFLNKLLYNQQKNRTIGAGLDNLKAGDHVYPSGAANRNGIVVGERGNNKITFVNNLIPGEYARSNDGQTLACNFLSVSDMLAYADWTGLRPLSEMEYEKMSRTLYPNVVNNPVADRPLRQEWAGGRFSDLKVPTGNNIADAGTPNEKLNGANINIGGKALGPVRVGSFADKATTRSGAGASEWGVMELGGNLKEIYYNMTQEAQVFSLVLESHGDGELVAESATDVQTGNVNVAVGYWPRGTGAFGLRGGSFKDKENARAMISDRADISAVSSIDAREADVSFRLGHSYTNIVSDPVVTYLTLQNGAKSVSDGSAIDSVCRFQKFKIFGSKLLQSTDWKGNDVEKTYTGRCTYYWWISENDGNTWKYIPGANGKDLEYSLNNEASDLRDVWIKRVSVTPTLYSVTSYVRIRAIDDRFEVSPATDTLKSSNQVLGFLAETKLAASYKWEWKDAPSGVNGTLKDNQTAAVSDFYFAKRSDFGAVSGKAVTVTCDIKILNKCVHKVSLPLYIQARPTSGILSNTMTNAQCGQVMKDGRDDSLYMTVKIGNQCWMAENLRYQMVGYSLNSTYDPTAARLGAFYKWDAKVRDEACPAGWRMPSEADFNTLNATINDGLNPVGPKLKAGNDWLITTANKTTRGNNQSGFGIVASSHRSSNNVWYYGDYAYFLVTDGYYWQISLNTNFARGGGVSAYYYMSIRCIKQ